MTEQHVTLERLDNVLVVHLDDGKANALSNAMINSITDAIDQAEADDTIGAVVLHGHPGKFSAGFDLNVMRGGDISAVVGLVSDGGDLVRRIYGSSVPVVAACTGHALAAGALILLACDLRIGADIDCKIGLNEVAIGMVLPYPALEVMRLRLTPSAYQQAVGLAKVFFGETALAAGWVDEIDMPDMVLSRAIEAAGEFATLQAGAHLASKIRARQPALDAIKAGIDNIHTEFGLS